MSVRALLFDRDGTLVHDVPDNGDPAAVRPVPGAAEALAFARLRGVRTAVVTNQPAIGRGLVTAAQVRTVNSRVDRLLGRFGTWQVCPHRPEDGCRCRKPEPGLVLAACAALGVAPSDAVLIGDIGADVGAAAAAGVRSIMVPTPVTRFAEVEAAPEVAPTLFAAVRTALTPAGVLA